MSSPAEEDLAALAPVERERRARELIEHHRDRVGYYATIRAAAIREVRAECGSAAEAARILGLTPELVRKHTRPGAAP